MKLLILSLLFRTIFAAASSNSIEELDSKIAIKTHNGQVPLRNRLRISAAESAGYRIFKQEAVAFAEPSNLEIGSYNVPLYTNNGKSLSGKYRSLLTGNTPLSNYQDSVHLAPINLGNQSFMVMLDTGSADLWVIGSGYKCTNSEKPCNFGPQYKQTKSFVPILDRKMDVLYATGERVQGKLGFESVSLGNITVRSQAVGLINVASWMTDGNSSGILGMAWPRDTRAYDLSANPDDGINVPYNPLFTSMYKQGLIGPIFSLALNRKNEGPGVLALGGLPASPIRYSNNFAHAKFEYLEWEDAATKKAKGYTLYMIKTSGFIFNSNQTENTLDTIIDSGSPLNYFPADVVKAANTGWIPPAEQHPITSHWIVHCNAVPPKFGIVINGTNLMVDMENMAVKGGIGNLPVVDGKEKCLSTVQEQSVLSLGIYVLGAPFMKSVAAVFDIGAAEMRFAQRIR